MKALNFNKVFDEVEFWTHLVYGPEKFGGTQPHCLKELWMIAVNFTVLLLVFVLITIAAFGIFIGWIFSPLDSEKLDTEQSTTPWA